MKYTTKVYRKLNHINKINFRQFIWINILFIFSYLFLYIPSIEDNGVIKFYFDSLYYLEFSQNASIENINDVIFYLFSNRLGPLVIYKLSGGYNFIIFIINISIFWFSLYRLRDLNIIRSPLLWINLVLLISVVSISKEIFIVLYTTYLYSYVEKKELKHAVILVLISMLVRWQLFASSFLIIFYVTFKKYLNKKIFTYFFIIGFLVVYSYVVKIVIAQVEDSIDFWVNQSLEKRGKGLVIYMMMTQYDRSGFYFLTFFFKFVFLSIAGGIKFLFSFNIDLKYFHNFAETTQSFCFIYLFYQFKRIKRVIKKDHLISVLLLSIIFTGVQIFTPRYLFPIFFYLTILWQKTKKISY